MSESSPGPGSIKIVKFELRSPRQKETVPLSNLVNEINIYSDIRSPFMTANIMVSDATSLFTLYPITGEEYIDIEFKVDDSAFLFPFKKTFRISSITDIVTDKQPRLAMYRIRCYEPEAFNDWNKIVRKSYSNTNTSDMIKRIFDEYLKESDSPQLLASNSDGNRTIVIPSMRPAEAIKFLCRESYSVTYPASNFVFYSTTDGFHFTTIEELIATKKVQDKYSLQDKNHAMFQQRTIGNGGRGNASAPGKPKEWLKIINYKFLSHANMEKTLPAGGFDNTHYFLDIPAGVYDNMKYSYGADIEKFKRMDRNPGGDFIYKDSPYRSGDGSSHHRFTITNKVHDTEMPDMKYEMLHLRTGANALMEHIAIELTVPGDCTRMVGDMIRLAIPEYSSFDNTIEKENIFLSGDYLVTSVRHMFNSSNKGYSTIIQCMKNSLNQAPEYSDILQGRSTNTYNSEDAEETTNTTPSYPSTEEVQDRR